MANNKLTSAAGRVVRERLKNRKLPRFDTSGVSDPATARALENISEHLRLYEGEGRAPKERFVTLSELEQAGLIKADVKQGLGYISKVLNREVAQEAGSTVNPTLKDPVRRDTTRQSRTPGGGGGAGATTSSQQDSTQSQAKLNDLSDLNVAKPKQAEALVYDGGKWTGTNLFTRQNRWTGRQQFDDPLSLLNLAASPSAVPGRGLLYTKDDNDIYYMDATGTETSLLGGGVSTLGGLTDVTLTTPTTGDVLRYNGTVWVNYPDSNFATSTHTHLLAAGATDVTATAAEVNLLDLSGLTAGWALIADSATTASWQAITLSDVSDVTATAAEVNLLDLSGLTAGWALIADSATTASWQEIPAPSGGFDSYNYTYDSNTATADPGAGNIRFNNAVPSSANRFMISGTDGDGNNLNALIDDYWTGHWGIEFRMVKADDPAVYVIGSINSTSDQGVWHNPYINWVETNGTFTNGDAVKVQITNRAYVHKPSTDHGIYVGSATLSAQPLNGLVQSALITHDPSAGSAKLTFNDGGPVNFTVNGGNTDITGSAIFQIRASNRFELYGSSNILPRLTVTETGVSIGHSNDSGNSTPTFAIHERTSAAGTVAEWGYIWVKSDTPNTLYFTDDSGTDHNLIDVGASSQTISSGWSTGSGGSVTIGANAPLFYNEQATNDTPGIGQGQVWVRSDIPNTLMFTDDAGTDFIIGGAASSSMPAGTADGDIIYYDGASWTTAISGNNVARILPDGTSAFGGGDIGPELRFIYDDAAGITWDHAGSGSFYSFWLDQSASVFNIDGSFPIMSDVVIRCSTDILAAYQIGSPNFNIKMGQFGSNVGLSTGPSANHLVLQVGNAAYGIKCESPLYIAHRAGGANNNYANHGQLWVGSTNPQHLTFTNDDGDDWCAMTTSFQLHSVFTTNTAATQPGVGYFKFNNATMSSVTALYIQEEQRANRFEDFEWPRVKAGDLITFKNLTTPANSLEFYVTGAGTDNSTWWTIPVAHLSGPTTPATNEVFEIKLHPTGGTGATPQTITAGWSTGSGGSGGSLTIGANAPLFMEEQAADDGPAAGQGQVWLRSTAPNVLMFTNDDLDDLQLSPYVQTLQTTDATQTEIFALAVPSGSSIVFEALIIGREDATGDTCAEKIVGLISNEAGTTALIGTPGVDRHESAGATAWVVTVAADDTGDTLTFDVTGEAAHTIDWRIHMQVIEV